MTQSKGFERERELVNALYDEGFAATRVPKSGGGTKRELPDIVAGYQGNTYAIEAKAWSEATIYLSREEINSLIKFARNMGSKARIAVRYDREDWYFFHPGDLYSTDGGSFRVKKETALVHGTTFTEFVESASEGEKLREKSQA